MTVVPLPYPFLPDQPEVQTNFEALAIATGQRAVQGASGTTFPTVPFEGQRYTYVADATNGVLWTFEYHATASSYDWWFVGGPALMATVATAQGTTSATYTALGTAGPVVTVPFAGDWDVYLSGTLEEDVAANAFMSYDIGGTGAVDVDAINAGTPTRTSPSRLKRKTAVAASTVLTAKYRSDGVNTATFRERTIAITPVRIA